VRLLRLGLLLLLALPAGAGASAPPTICASGECVTVTLAARDPYAGDPYGIAGSVLVRRDGVDVGRIDGVAALIAPTQPKLVGDEADGEQADLVEQTDWFADTTVSAALGTTAADAVPISFDGSWAPDTGLLDCGPGCYLIARPLRGTLDLPAETPSGAWNVWFSLALPDERVLEAPPVSLFIHERPAVRVVVRRRTAVVELRASYTSRTSPSLPFAVTIEAARKGRAGWGNPRFEGYDPRFYRKVSVRLTKPATVVHVPVRVPAAGRWRVKVLVNAPSFVTLADEPKPVFFVTR
jgi:hypothetical protein